MKMSLLVDHEKAQSLRFQTKFVSCKSGAWVLVKPGMEWNGMEWTERMEHPGNFCTIVWLLMSVFQLCVALTLQVTKIINGYWWKLFVNLMTSAYPEYDYYHLWHECQQLCHFLGQRCCKREATKCPSIKSATLQHKRTTVQGHTVKCAALEAELSTTPWQALPWWFFWRYCRQ